MCVGLLSTLSGSQQIRQMKHNTMTVLHLGREWGPESGHSRAHVLCPGAAVASVLPGRR